MTLVHLETGVSSSSLLLPPQLHQPEFCLWFSVQRTVRCMGFPSLLYQHSVPVNLRVLWICSWRVMYYFKILKYLPSEKFFVYPFYHWILRKLAITRRISLLYQFFRKENWLFLSYGERFTMWKFPLYWVLCFFGMQL